MPIHYTKLPRSNLVNCYPTPEDRNGRTSSLASLLPPKAPLEQKYVSLRRRILCHHPSFLPQLHLNRNRSLFGVASSVNILPTAAPLICRPSSFCCRSSCTPKTNHAQTIVPHVSSSAGRFQNDQFRAHKGSVSPASADPWDVRSSNSHIVISMVCPRLLPSESTAYVQVLH